MTTTITPDENFVFEHQIESLREARVRTQFAGCTQTSQLFLKADGKISCSCMRYWDILAVAPQEDLGRFFNGPVMRYIRESFLAGYEPFSFCEGCSSRLSECKIEVEERLVNLHIEPSNQCNLYCEACTCTFERLSGNPPPRLSLDFSVFEKAVRDIKAADLAVGYIAFVGFGEPLFNDELPRMSRLGRELFPAARIFVDTNANFGAKRARELADCGLDEIRLALDGIDQPSYEPYRRAGDFDRALEFTRTLADAIRETGSRTQAVWKYILFRHNDSDAQLKRAVDLAREIGISIVFDATVGDLASSRPRAELEQTIGHPIGCNIDPAATPGEMMPLGVPEEGSPLWRRVFRRRPKPAQEPAGTL